MFDPSDVLMLSRSSYYLLGVFVVVFVIFTTAAKRPGRRCRRCQEVNRPMARFCAQCGKPLGRS